VGFTGARLDHELAVFHSLVARPEHAASCSASGLVFAPRPARLDLPPGTRVSLFPMTAVTGRSEGLRWPIDGLDFHPAHRIGTSNAATGGMVERDRRAGHAGHPAAVALDRGGRRCGVCKTCGLFSPRAARAAWVRTKIHDTRPGTWDAVRTVPHRQGQIRRRPPRGGFVEDGMRVGLGTGSTAAWMVRCLGEMVREEGMKITGVATSAAPPSWPGRWA
jgi:hypothetical protein